MQYGILITAHTATKAKRLLTSMHKAGVKRGLDVSIFGTYQPCDVLMLYGLGGHDRIGVATRHKKLGKTFIAWDIGYFDRQENPRPFRFSFNGNHPHGVMQGYYPAEDRLPGLTLKNVSNPNGPILLVGNGPKSCAIGARGWTAKKSIELRRLFPSKEIIYRPKPKNPAEQGVEYDQVSTGPIEQALEGVSLVVCLHSNVAIDACKVGVPVVCDAGAAAAIYPQLLNHKHRQPDELTRMEFLKKLAWWQWNQEQADEAWSFILRRL